MVRIKLNVYHSFTKIIIIIIIFPFQKATKIKEFIDHKRDKLPNFIKTKLENLSLKYYSTISLFHSIFYHYPSEDVYADGIELPLPTIDLELKQTLTDELKVLFIFLSFF